MKKFLGLCLAGVVLSTSVNASDDCYVGFKVKNAVFKQELRNSTVNKLGLKSWMGDQFNPDLLTFEASPEYDRRGNYQKCEISNLEYAGENFSGLGTALKKGAVGTGLFAAGIGTLALTVAALYFQEEGNSNRLQSVEKSHSDGDGISSFGANEKDRTVVYIDTYGHLYPGYTVYIHDRRHYRTTYVHYHYHYMSAYEYHRLRTLEAGAILATMLIVEAFEVPRNMRSTNFQGPAEKHIAEADCSVEAIKERLMFDSYLYCGKFKSSAVAGFQNKNSVATETLREFLISLKRGKLKKAEKYLMTGRGIDLASLRAELASVGTHEITIGEALDGMSPLENVQRLKATIGSREVELICDQEWSYQREDLYRVSNDFIPLNRYSSCLISL